VCEREAIGAPSMLRLIRNAVALTRMFPTLDLDVVDLRFELGVETRSAEMEQVLVCLRRLNS
jgi:hypothetical protein